MTTDPPGVEATGHDVSWRAVVASVAAMVVVVAAVTALVVVAAVGARENTSAGHGSATTGDVAPLDLETVSDQIAGHYRYARAHVAEFRQIPCWCGCEQFLGHRDLADCFVRADGRGWEAHAAGCGVCNAEAAIAERMLGEGRSPGDVKAAVDQQFGATAITTPPAA